MSIFSIFRKKAIQKTNPLAPASEPKISEPKPCTPEIPVVESKPVLPEKAKTEKATEATEPAKSELKQARSNIDQYRISISSKDERKTHIWDVNFYGLVPENESKTDAENYFYDCVEHFTKNKHLYKGKLFVELAIMEGDVPIIAIGGNWDTNQGLKLPANVMQKCDIFSDAYYSFGRKPEYLDRIKSVIHTVLIRDIRPTIDKYPALCEELKQYTQLSSKLFMNYTEQDECSAAWEKIKSTYGIGDVEMAIKAMEHTDVQVRIGASSLLSYLSVKHEVPAKSIDILVNLFQDKTEDECSSIALNALCSIAVGGFSSKNRDYAMQKTLDIGSDAEYALRSAKELYEGY